MRIFLALFFASLIVLVYSRYESHQALLEGVIANVADRTEEDVLSVLGNKALPTSAAESEIRDIMKRKSGTNLRLNVRVVQGDEGKRYCVIELNPSVSVRIPRLPIDKKGG